MNVTADLPRTECCFERPRRERIDDILKNRKYNVEHMHMRYEVRRDYLQLCCEIDYLRADLVTVIADRDRWKKGLEGIE